MKKVAAVVVSIGVILVIAGLVMVGIFGGDKIVSGELFLFGSADLSSAKGGKDLQPAELEGLQEINVNVSAYAVYVLKSDNDVASVKYIDKLDDGVEINVEYDNGVLSVTQTDHFSHVFWGFNWFGNRRFIVIYLPQTEQFTKAKLSIEANYSSVKIGEVDLSDVKIKTDAGSVNIDTLNVCDISVETSAGSVSVDDVNAQSFTLVTNAGSVNVDEVKCNDCTVRTDAGSVNIDELTTDSVSVSTGAGSIKLENVEAQSINLSSGAGSIKCTANTVKLVMTNGTGSIKFNTNAPAIELSSGAGRISGTVKGSQSEYQIEVEHGMGSSNISNQTVQGATKFLKVESDIGSIDINFVQK